MEYQIEGKTIKVYSTEEFNPEHIFECGQVFSYKKIDNDCYAFYPDDNLYLIYKNRHGLTENYIIKQIGGSAKIEKAVEIFHLKTSYADIKNKIYNLIKRKNFKLNKQVIKNSIEFGYGIRLLKQDLFETIISFVFSQNNNIKRIKNSLDKLRQNCGEKIEVSLAEIEDKNIMEKIKNLNFYTFPSIQKMSDLDESFFLSIGAGYRAKFLVKLIKEINQIDIFSLDKKDTLEARKEIMQFHGVGRKVADCILLFGMGRKDVFPVDTWISQVYNDLTTKANSKINAIRISDILEKEFKELSGFIQQYLFFYKRTLK